MNGLEMMRALAAGRLPEPPVASLVGLEMVEVDEGRAVFALDAGRRHANPMGTLHGGILCDLGDAAMGCAVATTLDEGQSYTTLELKANFFKPVRSGRLTARASVRRRTRRIRYAEVEVADEGGSLVAKLSSTCLVLDGTDAEGR